MAHSPSYSRGRQVSGQPAQDNPAGQMARRDFGNTERQRTTATHMRSQEGSGNIRRRSTNGDIPRSQANVDTHREIDYAFLTRRSASVARKEADLLSREVEFDRFGESILRRAGTGIPRRHSPERGNQGRCSSPPLVDGCHRILYDTQSSRQAQRYSNERPSHERKSDPESYGEFYPTRSVTLPRSVTPSRPLESTRSAEFCRHQTLPGRYNDWVPGPKADAPAYVLPPQGTTLTRSGDPSARSHERIEVHSSTISRNRSSFPSSSCCKNGPYPYRNRAGAGAEEADAGGSIEHEVSCKNTIEGERWNSRAELARYTCDL